MPTGIANLDTTQYIRVNQGLNPMILQSNRDQVRVTLSDAKPVASNTAFHQLQGGDAPMYLKSIDTNVWALAATECTSLTVTEFTGTAEGQNPVDTIQEFAMLMLEQLCLVTSNQRDIVRQMEMLNLRVEEAFETDIDEDYLDVPSN